MKDVSLSVGYSLMRGTSTMDVVKGGNHKSWQDWGMGVFERQSDSFQKIIVTCAIKKDKDCSTLKERSLFFI